LTFPTSALNHFARVIGGSTPGPDPRYWGGDVNWLTPADVSRRHGGEVSKGARTLSPEGLDSCSAMLAPTRSVVVTTRAPIGNVALTLVPSATNQGCRTLVPDHRLDARYLRYQLQTRTDELQSYGAGSTFSELSGGALGSTQIHVPPVSHQCDIADFLDRECERIEAVLRAQDDLGVTARQAKRDHVRRELEADIESVPAAKLGWHFEVIPGYPFPSESFVGDPSDVRLLRGANVGVGRTDWSEMARWPAHDAQRYQRWLLRAGDLVLGLDRPWIKGGTRVTELTGEDVPALLLQRVACLRPSTGELLSQYVRLWIEHERFFADLGTEVTGVSVPHISPGQVAGFRVPVPDIERQLDVVRQALRARLVLRRLGTELEQLSGALNEYRDALITEAVTGKLDVTRLSDQQLDESAHAAMEGEYPEVLA